MGSFWNRHAGPATPVARSVAGTSQGAAPAPAPASPADLAARASASSGGSPPGRLGQLPPPSKLGRRRAAEGERVPLSRELDPDRRYLWAMTAPNAPGEAPGIHLGTERPVTDAKGRVDKLGHPAILNTSLGRGGRHIRHAKQFSGNPLRFVEQLIGAHETKDLPLAPQPPIRRP